MGCLATIQAKFTIVVYIIMYFSAYKTVSGVNGPLVILDDVKVKILYESLPIQYNELLFLLFFQL